MKRVKCLFFLHILDGLDEVLIVVRRISWIREVCRTFHMITIEQ